MEVGRSGMTKSDGMRSGMVLMVLTNKNVRE